MGSPSNPTHVSEPTAAPKLDTLAARGVRARTPDEARGEHSAAEPLYQTTVFDFPTVEASEGPLAGEGDGYVYSRYGLPNARTLEQSVAALEGGAAGLATASGMAAIATAILGCCREGDTVLCQADSYGGTRALLDHDLPRMGLRVQYVDAYDPAAVADALGQGARLLLVESLSNPLVREVDTNALAWHCRARGAKLCVDNTFATPMLRRPISTGADLVVHSASKFLGGHHDLCAGVVVGDAEMVEASRGVAKRMGCTAAPLDAWLTSRGLKTLHLRVERGEANAKLLAERLGEHPAVGEVHYPGWSAMLSFELADEATARRAVSACEGLPLTPSLGGTQTTLSHPASSSHRPLTAEQRAELGISDGLLRISCGVESGEDLWNELSRALNTL